MDIGRLDMAARGNAGAWIDIVGPDGEATDIKFQIRGARSDAVREAVESHQQAVAEAVRNKKMTPADFDALDKARDAAIAVASTMDWRGMEEGGKPIPCTPEKVKHYLTHPGYDWLAVQVYAKSQEAGLFLKP